MIILVTSWLASQKQKGHRYFSLIAPVAVRGACQESNYFIVFLLKGTTNYNNSVSNIEGERILSLSSVLLVSKQGTRMDGSQLIEVGLL